jgi:hypothetical protein
MTTKFECDCGKIYSERAAVRECQAASHGAPLIGMDKVIADVKRKRQRQVVVHGWSRMHDDTYTDGSLAIAAIPFIQAACNDKLKLTDEELQVFWPWPGAFSAADARREHLINAAALLVAEIERLDRAAPATTTTGSAGRRPLFKQE